MVRLATDRVIKRDAVVEMLLLRSVRLAHDCRVDKNGVRDYNTALKRLAVIAGWAKPETAETTRSTLTDRLKKLGARHG